MGMKCHKEIKKRRLRRVFGRCCLLICTLLPLIGCRKETADDEHEKTEELGTSITDIQDEETVKQYDGDYEYEILEDDTVMILSYHGSEEYVFIPEKLESKVVSAIGEKAFYSNGNVREVLLPSSIVSIGELAFAYCSRLEYIIMGQGVKEIDRCAFAYCASLLEIHFPEGLTNVGNGICIYCPSLEKVYLPQSMKNMGVDAFTGCTNLQLIYGSTPYAERYAIQEGKTYVDLNRIEIDSIYNQNIESQNNEKLPEVYYRILNNGMAVEGEGREYTKEEIMADSDMPLIFRTILCGYFEDIPWGDITLDEEKDIYYEEYQNKEIWQFLLKDLDGDARDELIIRDEEGRLMIFYEQWGDMEGTEGHFYWCTMGEGDEDSSIMKMLQDEHNEIPSFYLCDIYLNNGLLASFSRLIRNGHTDIYINIEKGTVYGTKQYLEECWIRTINNYEEYQSYLKYFKISYDDDDDRSKMTQNGTYYFIDGEMVSGEDVEAWLEEKVWQQMIPAEEWGIVP